MHKRSTLTKKQHIMFLALYILLVGAIMGLLFLGDLCAQSSLDLSPTALFIKTYAC